MAAVAMIAVLLAVTATAVAIGSAVAARHRAQAAADLAALAAAGRVASGQEAACTWATSVATAIHTRVTECRIEQLDVVIRVEARVSLGRFGIGSADGVARAGPVVAD